MTPWLSSTPNVINRASARVEQRRSFPKRRNKKYLEDPKDIYHEIMGDTEGQNALIDALKEKGINFAEEHCKIQRMMSSIEKQINKEE